MNYEVRIANNEEVETLVNIRIEAMRESLEAVGRFDPTRARNRFIDSFEAKNTHTIRISSEVMRLFRKGQFNIWTGGQG